MTLTVDTANLEVVTAPPSSYITYNGHHILYNLGLDADELGQYTSLTVECELCGEEHSLGGRIPQRRLWTAIVYLLHKFDDGCCGDFEEVVETIEDDILPRHTGKLLDQNTRRAIQDDVTELFGDVDVTLIEP